MDILKGVRVAFARERLLSLVEFAQQSARLRSKPAATVTEHGVFALYEHQVQGLPGIRLNVSGGESEDETWLTVVYIRKEALPTPVPTTIEVTIKS